MFQFLESKTSFLLQKKRVEVREGNLRMQKSRQKIFGCFRSMTFAQYHARSKGYISKGELKVLLLQDFSLAREKVTAVQYNSNTKSFIESLVICGKRSVCSPNLLPID